MPYRLAMLQYKGRDGNRTRDFPDLLCAGALPTALRLPSRAVLPLYADFYEHRETSDFCGISANQWQVKIFMEV